LGPFYVQKRPEADFGFGANFGTPFGSGSQLIFSYGVLLTSVYISKQE
jgi:hypothetical protein